MIKRTIYHGFLFLFSKSTVFFAPILAASILDNYHYGLLEWAISVSFLLATFLSFASGNTIAFEKIKNDHSPLIRMGKQYSLFLFLIVALCTFLSDIFYDSYTLTLVLGISSILIIQDPLSAYIKAAGLGARASVFDSALYIFLMLILLFTFLNDSNKILYLTTFPLFGCVMAFLVNKVIKNSSKISTDTFLDFIKRGFPIMVSGMIGVLFFSLPRLVLGTYSTTLVGDFSLYLRWASLALVGYQFVYVLSFRNIYKMKYNQFEKIVTKISVVVFFVGLAIPTVLYLLPAINITFFKLPDLNIAVQSLMIIIVSCWVISALLEGLFYREKETKYHIYSYCIGIMMFFLSFFSLNKFFNNLVELTALAWTIGFIFINIFQVICMEKYILNNQKFKKIRLLIFFFTMLTSLTILNIINGTS